ncbi:methyltransferase type 11 [Wenjunlia vitaminophila]|uniref:Methyltransferase type 11 n=2 Tax=Wenjunlia vitaminophila TaxID=76728 RepID=A0A0T6LW84_WENVI|nr:methyltransferase type 11 [Wenjunlia vitaminophila]
MSVLTELATALGLERGRTVVDIGAGTGKFTRLLALTGARVLAVEPVAAMRESLAELLPSVTVIDGTGERTGLPDGSVDAVVAAQSWHWFQQEAALSEVERVLRAGGALALVWNTYDVTVPWVRDFEAIYFRRAPSGLPSHHDGAWRRALEQRPGWSPVRERHLPNPHSITRQQVVERMLSSSHIAALDRAGQARVRAEVEEVLQRHAATRDRESVEVPYITDVYWARRG